MKEFVRQSDIEDLLRGEDTATDSPNPAEASPYDFVRPPRISKDRLSLLEAIYTRFAVSLYAFLSGRLRTPLDVTLSSVEQVAFSEFVLSLESPCAAFVFQVGDRLRGQGLFDLSTSFCYHLIDRLFGGPGDTFNLRRPLTPLERTVVRGVAERIVALFGEAWQEGVPMSPTITTFESSRDMLRTAGAEDNVLAASIEVTSGSFSGLLSVCVPLATFELFLQDRTSARLVQGRMDDADRAASRRRVASVLQASHLTVSARLPVVKVSARHVGAFQVGQVLNARHSVESPIEVHVNGGVRYLGSLGQVRGNVGVRIEQVIQQTDVAAVRKAWTGRLK